MPSSPRAATTSVAPNSRPRSVRSVCLPIRMICSAPSRLAGEHAAQPDGAVADDGDGVAGPNPGGDGAVVPGAVHVGQRQQRRHQRRVRGDRKLDQGALGQRHPNRLALTGVHPGVAPAAAVAAGDLEPVRAEVAGVVRPHERRDDQVAGSEAGHLRADLLDDADELVAHAAALLAGGHRPVGPQVAAADAGGGDADDGVGGLAQHWVGHVLDTHVAGLIHDGCSHEIPVNVYFLRPGSDCRSR